MRRTQLAPTSAIEILIRRHGLPIGVVKEERQAAAGPFRVLGRTSSSDPVRSNLSGQLDNMFRIRLSNTVFGFRRNAESGESLRLSQDHCMNGEKKGLLRRSTGHSQVERKCQGALCGAGFSDTAMNVFSALFATSPRFTVPADRYPSAC